MSEIRQCWAYSSDGVRCEHPAAHAGKHAVTREWSDSECFEPIKVNRPVASPATPIVAPVETKPRINCVACNHNHVGGVCKCGCYESIG